MQFSLETRECIASLIGPRGVYSCGGKRRPLN